MLIVTNFAKTPQILCAILLNNRLIPPYETESHEVADQVRDEMVVSKLAIGPPKGIGLLRKQEQ